MTANRKRLPAGRIYRLFLAGADIRELAEIYDVTWTDIEAALRRQIARMVRS